MNNTIDYSNCSLFYRIIGEGQPIVLLHGFAEDGDIWDQQAVYLKNNYLLIIPDLPGSGRSELSDDVSMEAMAGAVYAILEKEKVAEVIMIGHSMGGYVTLAFAERFPSLLKAFGLFHSTAFADSEEKSFQEEKYR